MAEHGHVKRIYCDETCVLRLGDIHQITTVKNISFGGALVHFDSSPPKLHIGDKCNISMNGVFLREYSCVVVRAGTPNIAVSFTGMRKFEVVEH
jgi:hypothetical protein